MFYEMVALCITEKVLTYANWLVSAKSTLKSLALLIAVQMAADFFIHFE